MGKNNAIQTDAETTDDNQVVEPTPHLNPRVAAMDAIADRLDESIREELGLPPEDVPPEVNDDAIKPVDQIEKQMAEPETPPVVMKRVKIDGEEREVTEEELIRNFQKDQTASKRLEQAAQRQKELDAREAEINAREAQLNKQSSLPEPQAIEKPAIDDAVADKFLNAIYEGNNAEAKELLGKLLPVGRGESATPAPAVDLDGITTAVKGAIKAEDAMDKFRTEYKDIIADPKLAKVADAFLDEELRTKDFADALSEAGRRTREWLAEITPKTPPAPDTGRQERALKKETIDNLPSTSSVSGSVDEEADESPSEVIRKMRLSRGLPV